VTYNTAHAWAAGPERVYRRLAAAAIDLLPVKLAEAVVVDAGAGTGAAAHELKRRGARTIAVDTSAAMLTLAPPPAVVGDICRMPLRANAADACVACLVLSHVTQPQVALAELARVARRSVVATAFAAGAAHPVKRAADEILAASGYRTPDWYTVMKCEGEGRVGDPEKLSALARQVGLAAEVVEVQVGLDGLDAAALAGWRLGMAPVAAWLATMPRATTDLVWAQTVAAVQAVPAPPLPLLILSASNR
jgi:SAM-dependent methyltransferase